MHDERKLLVVAWRYMLPGGHGKNWGPMFSKDRRPSETREGCLETALANHEDATARIAALERERDAALASLSAVMTTETARQTLHKLADGQGIATDEGCIWLKASAVCRAAIAQQEVGKP